ncbi:MAG: hypothetical protein RLZZ584_4311, partial [Pseudomonadota bacterium]
MRPGLRAALLLAAGLAGTGSALLLIAPPAAAQVAPTASEAAAY